MKEKAATTKKQSPKPTDSPLESSGQKNSPPSKPMEKNTISAQHAPENIRASNNKHKTTTLTDSNHSSTEKNQTPYNNKQQPQKKSIGMGRKNTMKLPAKCANCGEKIIITNANQRYCDNCKIIVQRKQQRENYHIHKHLEAQALLPNPTLSEEPLHIGELKK